VELHDTGRLYILSCFTMNASDNFLAEEAIAQVSLGVYEYFT
jgi:hypothetical protein